MMDSWEKMKEATGKGCLGLKRAWPSFLKDLPSPYGSGVYKASLDPGKVRLIINGGGGHGALFTGFAGPGLADASLAGRFCTAPNAYMLYEAAKMMDDGAGTLFICNNFMGDYLNNDMALELLGQEGYKARAMYVCDDIFSALGEAKEKRGGLCGVAQVCKAAAAAADEGADLDTVAAIASKTNDRLRSCCVNLRDDKVYLGEGFSGEPGAKTLPFSNIGTMINDAVSELLNELPVGDGDKVYIYLNGHRKVSYLESLILLEEASSCVEQKGIELQGAACGCIFDNFSDQTGFILTLVSCDSELQRYMRSVSGYGFVA